MTLKSSLLLSTRAFLVLLSLGLGGCSVVDAFSNMNVPYVSGSRTPADESSSESTTTTVPVEQGIPGKKGRAETNSVEIMWVVPAEPLDGYLIRYGFERDNLSYQLRVRWGDLTIQDTPSHGKVFVHLIESVPGNKTVYMTLSGIKDGELSSPTDVIEVQ